MSTMRTHPILDEIIMSQISGNGETAELVCKWQYNEEQNYWETSCDRGWSLGSESASTMNYCPFCGRPLLQIPHEDGPV